MKTKEFKAETIIDLSYDVNSPEFQEALNCYRDCVKTNATVDDMLKHVAWSICTFGADTMVEGVGFVSIEGQMRNFSDDEWSGIEIPETDIEWSVSEF